MDEKTSQIPFRRYLPILTLIGGLFLGGSGMLFFGTLESDKAELDAMIEKVQEDYPTKKLYYYLVDVDWSREINRSTDDNQGVPEIVYFDTKTRFQEDIKVVAPGKPNHSWILKYNKPDWPDVELYTPTLVTNIRYIDVVADGDLGKIPSDITE